MTAKLLRQDIPQINNGAYNLGYEFAAELYPFDFNPFDYHLNTLQWYSFNQGYIDKSTIYGCFTLDDFSI